METNRLTEAKKRRDFVAQGGLKETRKYLLRLKYSVDKARTAKDPRTQKSHVKLISHELNRLEKLSLKKSAAQARTAIEICTRKSHLELISRELKRLEKLSLNMSVDRSMTAKDLHIRKSQLELVSNELIRLEKLSLYKSAVTPKMTKVSCPRNSHDEKIAKELAHAEYIALEAFQQLRAACVELRMRGQLPSEQLPTDPNDLAQVVELALQRFPIARVQSWIVNAYAMQIASEEAQARGGRISRQDYKSAVGDDSQIGKRGSNLGLANVERNATRLKNAAEVRITHLGKVASTVRIKPSK